MINSDVKYVSIEGQQNNELQARQLKKSRKSWKCMKYVRLDERLQPDGEVLHNEKRGLEAPVSPANALLAGSALMDLRAWASEKIAQMKAGPLLRTEPL